MVEKSKDSLKACFENVNILLIQLCYRSHVSVPWLMLYLTLSVSLPTSVVC